MITVLTRHGQVWRKVQATTTALGSQDVMIYSSMPFEAVPISEEDRHAPYFVESTHTIFLPRWVSLRKEDWIVYSTFQNPFGSYVPYRYVINGVQPFRPALNTTIYYALERE